MTVDPREDTFTLFIKQVGEGTRALAALAAGDVAQCLGPLGRPFEPPPAAEEAVLVAGGYGIAPFRLFGEELGRAGRRARLFYGGRSAHDLQLRDRFRDLPLGVVLATEDGSLGEKGRVTAPLESYLDSRAGSRPAARLRAGGHDARGGASGGGARPAGAGEPRSVDGLRHRHLPRLRRARQAARGSAGQVPLRLHGGTGVRRRRPSCGRPGERW